MSNIQPNFFLPSVHWTVSSKKPNGALRRLGEKFFALTKTGYAKSPALQIMGWGARKRGGWPVGRPWLFRARLIMENEEVLPLKSTPLAGRTAVKPA